MHDILFVEDHVELANLLHAFLSKEGFSLIHVTTGEAALDWLIDHKPRVVLLDLTLPNMDGFAVCKAVRAKGDIPVVILSAQSDREAQLTAFELGADDYVQKPADPDILSAKLRVLLNRVYGSTPQTIITSGAICIDTQSRKATLNDQPLELNVKEYELLLLFIKNTGKTLHKDFLFNEIWGSTCNSENQTLTVHIKMLRTKIEQDPRHPKRIQTVWGIGYRYEAL